MKFFNWFRKDKYKEINYIKNYKKKYRKTEIGKKNTLKDCWKSRGLNMENFEDIYERYTMAIFCDICECVLEGKGNTKKSMDHDHDTGDFRNIVCHLCNSTICK